MREHDPKMMIPAVILPAGTWTNGFHATAAMRSQLLYSWLRFTGLDRADEISFRW